MKKLLLSAVALLLSSFLMAQSRVSYISETFDGITMPEGWEIMGLGASAWSIQVSDKAGGTPNEARLFYGPTFTGISRLVTPAVDLTGQTSVTMQFKHFVDIYASSHRLGVATSSDNGVTWNEAWSETFSGIGGQYSFMEEISTPDIGNSNVRFCIFYDGYNYNINQWCFDDIMIFKQEECDAQVTSITSDEFCFAGLNDISFNVSNRGLQNITSLEVSYQVNDDNVVTETFDVNIEPLQNQELTFEQAADMVPGSHNVTVTIDKVNGSPDDDPNNDVVSKTIRVAISSLQRTPLIEHFSSSTCAPCVGANTNMLLLENNNPGKYAYIKYAMSWPNPGDPYYTEEGGARRSYYGISAVPHFYLDGYNLYNTAISQSVFDTYYANPAFVNIKGSFNTVGDTINIKAEVMSYVDLTSAKVYVVVNEKVTHGNTGTNGETEFHHIMMKMLNDHEGTPINILAGENITYEMSYDMSKTNVEEMDDLEVVVFVQETTDKHIYNSCFLSEYTDIFPASPIDLELEYQRDNTVSATWSPAIGSTPSSYKVYVNSELVAQEITETSYTFEVEPNRFYLVEIEAIYDDMTSVRSFKTIVTTQSTSIVESQNAMKVYPNPAQGEVSINSNAMEEINVYNVLGARIETIAAHGKDFIRINTESYMNGVYFFNIKYNDGSQNTTKIIISK